MAFLKKKRPKYFLKKPSLGASGGKWSAGRNVGEKKDGPQNWDNWLQLRYPETSSYSSKNSSLCG